MSLGNRLVPTGAMRIPTSAGFPWRRIVVGLVVLLLPLLVWVLMGLMPSRPKMADRAQVTMSRTSGKSLLADVSTSAVGVSTEPPAPEVRVVQTPGPSTTDTSDKDRLIDQLTRDNRALLDKLKAQKPLTQMPAAIKTANPEVARAAEELKKEAETARKSLDVWTAPAEAQKTGVQQPKTPYSLPPATRILAETEAEVTNQALGAFTAWVTHPVRTATGRVVIPPGSRLLLKTTSRGIFGDERLAVQVASLTFPDDSYIQVRQATVGDASGAVGFKDQVDHRWGSLFASVILTGVLRSGATLAGGGMGGDPIDRMGGAIAGETAQQGTQQVRQSIRTEPILTIRPRYAMMLTLEDELVLTKAYEIGE